jgi:hypothetical protein
VRDNGGDVVIIVEQDLEFIIFDFAKFSLMYFV